jgi:hypothetical protein
MERVRENFLFCPLLNDPSPVHHNYSIAYEPHNLQIVRDEYDGEPFFLFYLKKQTENLGLNGNVKLYKIRFVVDI